MTQPRILVVDDEEVSRHLLEMNLQMAGFDNVFTARDGEEALDLVSESRPDLILLDVMMPNVDGFEVTRRIRMNYPQEFIPIILVSALQGVENRVEGIEAGANDFLSRPFHSEELIARINSLLALKQSRDQLGEALRKLEVLFAVSQSISAHLETGALLEQIARFTTDLTGANKATLVLLNSDGTFQRKIIARRGENSYRTDTIDPRVLTEGLLGWVISEMQPALLPEVLRDPRWSLIPEDDLTQSAIAVPLMQSGETLGALMLTSNQSSAFTHRDMDLLQAIGAQAAIALEKARLYEEARQQRARTEALLNQTGDPVLVVDSEKRITRINPAASFMLNLPAEAVGEPLTRHFSLALEDLVLRAGERQAPVSGEFTVRRDGEQRSFNISVSPVEGVGFLMLWQDISALKENERVRLDSERIEKERLLQTLTRMMGPTLAERVLSDPGILARKEKRDAVVLFADLRGFTRLTVDHAPDAVMELLNEIFEEMFDAIYHHEGVLFDIVGDELMVAFNVPYDQADASERAVATAIEMQRRFRPIQARREAVGMNVGMGIGINRGPVVLGNVGTADRVHYAMVGEAVNIAHRLVEIAEDRQIVVTPGVMQKSPPDAPDLQIHVMQSLVLKGKDEPQPMVMIELAGTRRP